MIPVAEASLLAQVLPVGVLAVGLQLRLVNDWRASNKSGFVLLWFVGGVVALSLISGSVAEIQCVLAVGNERSLEGVAAAFVAASALLLLTVVVCFLVLVMLERFGLAERASARAMRRVLADPVRMLEVVNGIERHHPNAPQLTEDERFVLEARALRKRNQLANEAAPKGVEYSAGIIQIGDRWQALVLHVGSLDFVKLDEADSVIREYIERETGKPQNGIRLRLNVSRPQSVTVPGTAI